MVWAEPSTSEYTQHLFLSQLWGCIKDALPIPSNMGSLLGDVYPLNDMSEGLVLGVTRCGSTHVFLHLKLETSD